MIVKAGIILYDVSTKTFLTLHPSNTKEKWLSIPKGNLEANELPLVGALREFKEETSIDLEYIEVNHIYTLGHIVYGHKTPKKLYAFLFVVDKFSGSIELCWENDSYKWMSIDKPVKLYSTQRILIERAKKVLTGDTRWID